MDARSHNDDDAAAAEEVEEEELARLDVSSCTDLPTLGTASRRDMAADGGGGGLGARALSSWRREGQWVWKGRTDKLCQGRGTFDFLVMDWENLKVLKPVLVARWSAHGSRRLGIRR